jgi:hypothetical protein
MIIQYPDYTKLAKQIFELPKFYYVILEKALAVWFGM